ncbi:hypothetical protein K5549_016308, partial [Capra hircus]
LLGLRTAWRTWGFLWGFFASYPLPTLCLTVSSERALRQGFPSLDKGSLLWTSGAHLCLN